MGIWYSQRLIPGYDLTSALNNQPRCNLLPFMGDMQGQSTAQQVKPVTVDSIRIRALESHPGFELDRHPGKNDRREVAKLNQIVGYQI